MNTSFKRRQGALRLAPGKSFRRRRSMNTFKTPMKTEQGTIKWARAKDIGAILKQDPFLTNSGHGKNIQTSTLQGS